MTKKERLLNAFSGKPVDKIPMGFWYHFSPDEDQGEKTVQDHLDWYKKTDMDMIKIMCDGYFNYPNPFIKTVRSAKDWYDMTPLGEDHPWITKQVERVSEIAKRTNGECCLFYNVFCPMSLLRFGSSEEFLMSQIKEDPDAVCYAFSVIAEDIKVLIRKVIEAGCTGIYYCVQNAEKFRFSAEEYRRLVTPEELKLLEYANQLSDYNILHCCGWAGDQNRIEVWKDYPAACVNWAVYVEKMDLKEGREYFNCSCVLGGLDNRKTGILFSASKEEVQSEVEKTVRRAGRTGLVIGADCTLSADIDKERVVWVREKLDQMAQTPEWTSIKA